MLQNIYIIIDLMDWWVVSIGDSGVSETMGSCSWMLLCLMMVGKARWGSLVVCGQLRGHPHLKF